MKKLLLLSFVLSGVLVFSQESTLEIAPNSDINLTQTFERDTFELFFSFPTIAFVGEYGVETDGEYFYSTQWLGDSLGKYDQSGNLLEGFVINGVGQVRDMAYDGQYYYGSPYNHYFYILDLENKVLINNYQTSFRIRGMAYDAIEDVLWVSEQWEPKFYKLDKQGTILDSLVPSGITMHAISGLAFDNYSPQGPFLWGFSQDSSGAVIVKYDIANQSQTGNMIDVASLGSIYSIAGGLFLEDLDERTIPVLGGVLQNELHFGVTLAYANQLVGIENEGNMISLAQVYPNPARDVIHISSDIPLESTQNIRILNQMGQVVMQTSNKVAGASTYDIDISHLKAGVYFVQLSDSRGYSVSRKIVKE